MSTILAINTSSSQESVAVLRGTKIYETVWTGNKDESEKLIFAIERTLKKAGVKFADVDEIFVTKGPGPFSALRIGVTVANILGLTLKIPCYAVSTVDYWRARLSKKFTNAVLLLFAGGMYCAHQKNARAKADVALLEDILRSYTDQKSDGAKTPLAFFGDLTENGAKLFRKLKKPGWKWIAEKSLATFGTVIKNYGTTVAVREFPITPSYFKPPNITPPTITFPSKK